MMQTTPGAGADAGAGAPAHAPHGAEHAQYLTFVLGAEVFGLGILVVKEIIGHGGVTAVPMMPEYVRGVINLRGAVVPVIDLARRFGLAPRPVTKRTCVVIVEQTLPERAPGGHEDAQVFGLIVDAVNAVLNIARADIEAPPAFGVKIKAGYLHGMGRVDDGLIMLLEPSCILDCDDAESASADPVARPGPLS
ncbi:MAG: chemotaxis protein CheW [Janthinobacterium lividum]